MLALQLTPYAVANFAITLAIIIAALLVMTLVALVILHTLAAVACTIWERRPWTN